MRYQGHTDIELNETGYCQATKLAQRLASEPIRAVYSSDLKRALETARIIASSHQLEVEAISALREIHFGAWEGLTFEEIKNQYKDLVDKWYSSPGEIRIPQGETFDEVKKRAFNTVQELVKLNEPGAIVVVTHGGPIRAILCALLNVDLNYAFRIRQDNAALNIIDFYGDIGVLSLLNDTHHLGTDITLL